MSTSHSDAALSSWISTALDRNDVWMVIEGRSLSTNFIVFTYPSIFWKIVQVESFEEMKIKNVYSKRLYILLKSEISNIYLYLKLLLNDWFRYFWLFPCLAVKRKSTVAKIQLSNSHISWRIKIFLKNQVPFWLGHPFYALGTSVV